MSASAPKSKSNMDGQEEEEEEDEEEEVISGDEVRSM